jgi:hypothetical protein
MEDLMVVHELHVTRPELHRKVEFGVVRQRVKIIQRFVFFRAEPARLGKIHLRRADVLP